MLLKKNRQKELNHLIRHLPNVELELQKTKDRSNFKEAHQSAAHKEKQKKANNKHSEKFVNGYGVSKVNIQLDQN